MNKKKKKFKLKQIENFYGYLFASPAILGLLIFTVVPMIASLYLSLTDYNVIADYKFVGLDNYKEIFFDDLFFKKSLVITFIFAIGSTVLTLISALILALLMNSKVKGQGFFRTLFYLPVVVPAVASNILWLWLFNPDFGLFNSILTKLNLPTSDWIFDEKTAIPSLILMGVWACGGTALIFLAGLQDVPTQLLEAVEVDGGNWFHKFRYVTLPSLTPIIFFNLIMGLIGAFQTFSQAYIMTNGGPNNATLFYALLIYRNAFQQNQFGYASALAWILLIIISIFTLFIFRTAKSWVYYGGGE
ncbi:ABC transporter permease [Enterococcus sp. JM4C]|uniref:carbohydrate ABC transporter permease n=1 Tax=Candidatus Enterococcus huntleyi TaxID=1857217 RepID=UPI0013797179|nr:sugar ABC transporter permease [Enterococcus sp. JM4C]KAF1297982.1 ABC transporter permease [Enterococcus sp. JM4C]